MLRCDRDDELKFAGIMSLYITYRLVPTGVVSVTWRKVSVRHVYLIGHVYLENSVYVEYDNCRCIFGRQ